MRLKLSNASLTYVNIFIFFWDGFFFFFFSFENFLRGSIFFWDRRSHGPVDFVGLGPIILVWRNQSFHNGNYHYNNTQLRLSNSTLQCNLHAEMRWERSHKNRRMITFPSNAFKCVSRFQEYDRFSINTKQKIPGSSLVRVSISVKNWSKIVHFFFQNKAIGI